MWPLGSTEQRSACVSSCLRPCVPVTRPVDLPAPFGTTTGDAFAGGPSAHLGDLANPARERDRRTAPVPRTAARWLILGGHKGSSSVSLVFRFPGGANRVLCTSGRGGARGTPGISSLISSTSLFFKVQSVRLRSGSLCDESICRRIKTFRDFGCCWLTSPTLKVITPLFLNTRHGCLIIVI